MKITTFSLQVLITSSFFKMGVLSETPTTTFKGCSTPSFEWATYSNKSTGSFKPLRAAYANGNVFAAGLVKSTIDPDVTTVTGEYELSLTGPYSVSDVTGTNAVTYTADLESYSAAVGAIENGGGTWGQYDVGVAKIDAATGEPKDFFMWKGDGLDETSGLAASGDSIAVSGHFTGHLEALLADGTTKTIWNSNVGVGGIALDADQFHPNNRNSHALSGVDDGYIIKASAITGLTDWIVHWPKSNQDAEILAVDFDSSMNVFAAGYSCNQAEDAEFKTCDAVVGMFSSDDGALIWEKTFPDLGALFTIKWDSVKLFEEAGLYVTGTTTYGGSNKGNPKDHPLCDHDSCSVIMRLSSTDGEMQWTRTVKGSPRWGLFDQSGGLVIGERDDPFIYVAMDDTGEGAVQEATLHTGTSYGGCLSAAGIFTPEYHIFMKKVVVPDDCDFFDDSGTSTFISRQASEAAPASSVISKVSCGSQSTGDACLMKFHKHTGLPVWAVDVPPVAGLVVSPDSLSVHIAGWYSPNSRPAFIDAVSLPGYLKEGALGTQKSGIYNAKVSAETGAGEYVMHSGGGATDRVHALAGDPDGNLYNIGYHKNLVMNWGHNLKTTMVETDDPDPKKTEAVTTNMLVSKIAAATQSTPSCLTTCDGNTDEAVIDTNSCFIDGQCYPAGATADEFGMSCFECDPDADQRTWSEAPTLGVTQCYIDKRCLAPGEFYFYQRRSWSAKIPSLCKLCSPLENAREWSLTKGFEGVEGAIPPNDCAEVEVTNGVVGVCFSGENTVEVMGRGLINMHLLKLGDSVLVQGGEFAKVYSFGHYDKDVPSNFLQIRAVGVKTPLELSKDHMVFVLDGAATKSVPASAIKVGDMIATKDGASEVSKIENVKRNGAYAPFTTTGDIVVSGVVASNYISMLPEEETGLPVTMQWIAHTFNAPHRMICSINFSICENETYTNGLSNWIYGPYHAGKWLAQQNAAVKLAGCTTLVALMLGAPILMCVLILGVLVKNLNKSKAL